jgi:hypothetical protein
MAPGSMQEERSRAGIGRLGAPSFASPPVRQPSFHSEIILGRLDVDPAPGFAALAFTSLIPLGHFLILPKYVASQLPANNYNLQTKQLSIRE